MDYVTNQSHRSEPGQHLHSVLVFLPLEIKACKKSSLLHGSGTDGDAVLRKPPLGRREASAPPAAPSGGAVVRRSDVCLSTFYAECVESELDSSGDPEERYSRSVLVPRFFPSFALVDLRGFMFRLQV